ncbi:MAG TPA: hypothetical protein VIF09_25825 [Polyangiaceae bacterium]|jgi:hypothetical protein
MNTQQFLARAVQTMRVLWAALTASTVLIAALTFFVVAPGPAGPVNDTNRFVIGLAALGGAIASFVVPMRIYRTAVARRRHEIAEGEPGPGGRAPARFVDPDAAVRHATASWMSPFIIGMALSESVSLDGLVEHVFRAPTGVTAVFFVAGTALALVRFPRPAQILGTYERAQGATFAASGRPLY